MTRLPETSPTEPILSVEGLSLDLRGTPLVEDVSFSIAPGEMLGLVGESGCGKSVTALSIMRLLPTPPIAISGGRILFEGTDLAGLPEAQMRRLRGRRMGMIFQEPMTALNPVFTIGSQIAEPLRIHEGLSERAALERAAELLARVGLPSPRTQLARYPHQLSGGQRQRVMIAMALACGPRLLVADEPTTALDVTVQAQILALVDGLRRDMGLACLLITHDLGVVAEICERVCVMYAGRIVEAGPIADALGAPRHRYTRALVETIPLSNPPGRPLPSIPGNVPPPGARPRGCAFADRCSAALDRCRAETPPWTMDGARGFACWNPA
ncbi:ABC transporter ATP-binding protein [Salinarimonas ramus]|uniref:ABC transporter ATP-binding protein n=1 Tax=Salinarimonas ramus TaxID=690164 RepID=A0A917QG03_9HYPH|nr:ABC transporter ATP-binding protein [Salinarimonas ramus]GGK48746.1 ABC transporter ATP-binding protein [Salinarimonas ramus]